MQAWYGYKLQQKFFKKIKCGFKYLQHHTKPGRRWIQMLPLNQVRFLNWGLSWSWNSLAFVIWKEVEEEHVWKVCLETGRLHTGN